MKHAWKTKDVLIASAVLLAGMVSLPVSDDNQQPGTQGWSVVGTAQAEGGNGRGRGRNAGSHTEHDHDAGSHTDVEHTSGDSDHDHEIGQDNKGRRGNMGERGRQGRAQGGGSQQVEELIFR